MGRVQAPDTDLAQGDSHVDDQEVLCKRATVHLQRWGKPRVLPLENLY